MNKNKPDQLSYALIKLNVKEKQDLKKRNSILKEIKNLKNKQKKHWSNNNHLEILKLQKTLKKC
jgi:hypothetical protein